MADDAELDALRRRLYRPGATDADRARYAEALAMERPSAAPEQPARPPVRPRLRARLLPVIAGAAVLLVVVVAGAGLAATSRPPVPPRTPPPVAAAGPVERLRLVGGAGVQAYRGRGAGLVTVDPLALPAGGGRLEVLFTTAVTGPVRWTAVRVEPLPAPVSVLADRSAVQSAGVPVPVDLDHDGPPPTWIRVDAPAGTRWGLVLEPAGLGPRLR